MGRRAQWLGHLAVPWAQFTFAFTEERHPQARETRDEDRPQVGSLLVLWRPVPSTFDVRCPGRTSRWSTRQPINGSGSLGEHLAKPFLLERLAFEPTETARQTTPNLIPVGTLKASKCVSSLRSRAPLPTLACWRPQNAPKPEYSRRKRP